VNPAEQDDLDYVGVYRLQAAYADAVSRRAWAELEPLFLPDARITVDTITGPPIEAVGAGGIGGFISGAIERFEFFELVILNVHVVAEGETAGDPDARQSRSFTCELRQERANGHWTNAFGIYRDDLARVDGRWRYARRRYQSLARTGRAEVFPFPTG
jgi:SnoaL-like domain